jgi:hypothetical protein
MLPQFVAFQIFVDARRAVQIAPLLRHLKIVATLFPVSLATTLTRAVVPFALIQF